MHRVLRPDGTSSQSEFIRWTLAASYAMFSLAGTLLLLSDELHNAYGHSATWMAGFLAVGGLACALGSALRHWAGEFIGGPLLVVGLAVLGMEVWLTSHDTLPLIATGNLLLFLGIAGVGTARWRVVLASYRFVHAVALTTDRKHAR